MHILLSNDDGIDALGLTVLACAARRLSTPAPRVTVVAPGVEHSGSSHRITLDGPWRVGEARVQGADSALMIDGTPCDAVRVALGRGGLLQHLGLPPVDLVLVGVNHGSNLGHDVWYSGTVAAALEAAAFGVPAIAVSRARRWVARPDDRDAFEHCLTEDLRVWWAIAKAAPASAPVAGATTAPIVLSVNYPGTPVGQFGPHRYTRHGRGTGDEKLFIRREVARPGSLSVTVDRRGCGAQAPEGRATDSAALAERAVSITPISGALTDEALLAQLDGSAAASPAVAASPARAATAPAGSASPLSPVAIPTPVHAPPVMPAPRAKPAPTPVPAAIPTPIPTRNVDPDARRMPAPRALAAPTPARGVPVTGAVAGRSPTDMLPPITTVVRVRKAPLLPADGGGARSTPPGGLSMDLRAQLAAERRSAEAARDGENAATTHSD